MKYYLIIGYQLLEKHKEFPTVNVSINDTLIDNFLCDNEESVSLESVANECHTMLGPTYKRTKNSTMTNTYSTPSKLQIYEIDSDTFNNHDDVLKIEVTKNYSDYTNGFLNKRSLAGFNPIFLIPKDLLHNQNSMHKLIKKFHYWPLLFQRRWQDRNYKSLERVVWPGYSAYPDHLLYNGSYLAEGCTDITVPVSGGGDFKILLNIKKRLGLHFLTHHNKIPKGFFFCDDFFIAWYRWQSKKDFTVNVKSEHNADKRKNPDDTTVLAMDIIVKNNINTDNEDQRSNRTKN